MRLIDADALEKAGLMMVKLSDKEDKLLTKFEWKDVPTAYDVETVVSELEKMKEEPSGCHGLGCDECKYKESCITGEEGYRVALDRAIEIVRGKE